MLLSTVPVGLCPTHPTVTLVICVCPQPSFSRTPILGSQSITETDNPGQQPYRAMPIARLWLPLVVHQGEWLASPWCLLHFPRLLPRVTFTGQTGFVMRRTDRAACCVPAFTVNTLLTPPASPTLQAPQHLARGAAEMPGAWSRVKTMCP